MSSPVLISLVTTSMASRDSAALLVDDWASGLGTPFWRLTLCPGVQGWMLAAVPLSKGKHASQLVNTMQAHSAVQVVTVQFLGAGGPLFVGVGGAACQDRGTYLISSAH